MATTRYRKVDPSVKSAQKNREIAQVYRDILPKAKSTKRILCYQTFLVETKFKLFRKPILTTQELRHIVKQLIIKANKVSREREPAPANLQCSIREESTS
jgi:hypothetical protein